MNTFQKKVKHLVHACVDKIDTKHVKHFTLTALQNAPDYVWTIMASTSGKYHHGELLSEHMLKAFYYGEEHVRMLGWWWDAETRDVFRSCLLLHDLYRCGFKDRESLYDDGRYRTDMLHPIYVARELMHLEYNIPFPDGPDNLGITHAAKDQKWFKKWQKAVAGHMGPWSPLPECNPMKDNALSLRLHVFLVDYAVSRSNINVIIPELEELRVKHKLQEG